MPKLKNSCYEECEERSKPGLRAELIVVSSYLCLLIIIITISSSNVNAQETENGASSPISLSADIVSSFLWRGMLGSPTLSFQPSINYSKSNFEIGFWGSGDNLNYIRELDIYVSYSVKGFSLTLTDYYWNMEKGYFNYKNNTTAHVFELGLSYENENFPLQIYAGTMLYGNDRKIAYNIDETDAAKNNYSTYFELSYTFNFSQHALKIFAGATPFTGFYGTDFSVVFVGLTGSKEIEITEKFSLPVFATFAINPQTEEYFVVLGLSL